MSRSTVILRFDCLIVIEMIKLKGHNMVVQLYFTFQLKYLQQLSIHMFRFNSKLGLSSEVGQFTLTNIVHL